MVELIPAGCAHSRPCNVSNRRPRWQRLPGIQDRKQSALDLRWSTKAATRTTPFTWGMLDGLRKEPSFEAYGEARATATNIR